MTILYSRITYAPYKRFDTDQDAIDFMSLPENLDKYMFVESVDTFEGESVVDPHWFRVGGTI